MNVLLVRAQSIEVGLKYEAPYLSYRPVPIGEDADNVYLLELDRPGNYPMFFLESFSKANLSRNYLREILPDYSTSGSQQSVSLAGYYFINGEFVYLLRQSEFIRKDERGSQYYRDQLVAHRISGSTGEEVSVDTMLMLNDLDLIPVEKGVRYTRSGVDWQVYTSSNRQRLAVVVSREMYDLNQEFQWIHVFDDHQQLLYSTMLKRNLETDKPLITADISVTSDGSIHFVKDSTLVYLDATRNLEKWEVPLHSLIAGDIILQSGVTGCSEDGGDLVLTGFYSHREPDDSLVGRPEKPGNYPLVGVIYFRLNPGSRTVESVKVTSFCADLYSEFATSYEVEKGIRPEIFNDYDHVQYWSVNNQTLVLAEEVVKDRKYGDFLVMSFSNEGKLTWSHRVPREQIVKEDLTVFGDVMLLDDQFLYLLFYDEVDNLDEEGRRSTVKRWPLYYDSHAVPIIYRLEIQSGKTEVFAYPEWNFAGDARLIINDALSGTGGAYMLMKKDREYQLAKVNAGTY